MSTTLTKADLAKKLSQTTGLPAKGVTAVLDGLGETIAVAVSSGVTVITGFGRFKPRLRPARIRRNPRTGEQVDVPETLTVSFTPAKPKS